MEPFNWPQHIINREIFSVSDTIVWELTKYGFNYALIKDGACSKSVRKCKNKTLWELKTRK